MSMPRRRIRTTLNPRSLRVPPAQRRKYKMDEACVREMRERRAKGERLVDIARALGVNHTTVCYWTSGAASEYLPLPWVSREVAAA